MSKPDSGPQQYFSADHRACDELWGQVEGAVEAGDVARAGESWKAFDAAMRRHFEMEEQVLFPALEEITGMHGMGPTEVMRSEHAQMRLVLDQMASDAARGDYEALSDQGDTLMMLIAQHNVKEEGMLYPMADQALAAQWPQVAEKLRQFDRG